MIRRGTYQSIWPLAQAAMTFAAKPLDRIASRWESFDGNGNPDLPQVLVVGLPRSGTTLVSQILARQLDVSFIPNVSAMFPSAPIWATKRFCGGFKRTPLSTSSFYGSTTGLGGINDGFHIWNRWLGHDRYGIDRVPSEAGAAELVSFFYCWNDAFRKPLLNKNNRNVDAMELLASLLPLSFFVVVQRDPILTVQSLLAARRFVQGSSASAWGLYSDRCDPGADAIDGTCEQVAIGKKRIREQLENVEPSRYLEIDYEQFCAAPTASIARIADIVSRLEIRDTDSKPLSLRASSKITLSKDDHRRIDKKLTELGA